MDVGLGFALVEELPRVLLLGIVDEGGIVIHSRVLDVGDGHEQLCESGWSTAHLHHDPVSLLHLGLHQISKDRVAGLDVEMVTIHHLVVGFGVDDGRVRCT